MLKHTAVHGRTEGSGKSQQIFYRGTTEFKGCMDHQLLQGEGAINLDPETLNSHQVEPCLLCARVSVETLSEARRHTCTCRGIQ